MNNGESKGEREREREREREGDKEMQVSRTPRKNVISSSRDTVCSIIIETLSNYE